MQDVLLIDGDEYISTKRAAEILDYSADYIGQLARGGKIKARRVERAWVVNLQSLKDHKEKAEAYVPVPPVLEVSEPLETIVGLDGIEYVSAKRAAEISHYNPDYVAQLAREGKVPAKQVANRWYVAKTELLKHKEHNDALLAAVQAASAGVARPAPTVGVGQKIEKPLLSYTSDNRSLFPEFVEKKREIQYPPFDISAQGAVSERPTMPNVEILHRSALLPIVPTPAPVAASRWALALTLATTVGVLVLALGYGATQNQSFYASAEHAFAALADVLADRLEYSRSR